MPKQHNYPSYLKDSPEQRKEDAQIQETRKASFTRAHLTETERMIGRGALLEETAMMNLAAAKGDKAAETLAKNQLADAVAMQGRYAEAATLHSDPDRTKYFEEIQEAIERPDEEKCGCEDIKGEVSGTPVTITPRIERTRVFSPVHQEVVSLVECTHCHHLNARPVQNRLLQARAIRQQNRMAQAGRGSGRGLVRDTEILKDATVIEANSR